MFQLFIIAKAAQNRRTPKPAGHSGAFVSRDSVLDCGGSAPLSQRARASPGFHKTNAPLKILLTSLLLTTHGHSVRRAAEIPMCANKQPAAACPLCCCAGMKPGGF